MKRNNAIPNNHFRKTSLIYKTWFDQPARATRRRKARALKAKRCFPLPTQKLRPVVRCPTIRHNKKQRLGRGFTREECAAAGLTACEARSYGIAVDDRRQNRNKETFDENVERLKTYRGRLTFFASKEEARAAGAKQHIGAIMPPKKVVPTITTISPAEIASYN